MKKIILLWCMSLSIFADAKLHTVVSIIPQQIFVEAIGGEQVHVALMVKPGKSPHSYEPKPSQMQEIAKADVYFTIGVEFEKAWLPKFEAQNKHMNIWPIDSGIQKIEMAEHHHDDDCHHENHDSHDEKHDPHIWTSPLNAKIMAKNIYLALIKFDAPHASYYLANYNKLLDQINKTDQEITQILSQTETERSFMVFHPSWGYFARDYGLTQVAIEISGKNPQPKQMMHLIETAKTQKIKTIFVAPEYSDKIPNTLASELKVPVIKISSLNPNWSQNLIALAKAIASK